MVVSFRHGACCVDSEGVIVASKKKANTAKVGKVMREFKEGTLHSGKGGPVVKSRKQAVAIAMSEAKMSKVPKGYHRMPNGKLMEGAKHEARESKAEKRMEYGPKPKAKAKKK